MARERYKKGSKGEQANINRDIAVAYNKALEYTINRIRNYCNARNANYVLVNSESSISELLLKTLPEMGVLK